MGRGVAHLGRGGEPGPLGLRTLNGECSREHVGLGRRAVTHSSWGSLAAE